MLTIETAKPTVNALTPAMQLPGMTCPKPMASVPITWPARGAK